MDVPNDWQIEQAHVAWDDLVNQNNHQPQHSTQTAQQSEPQPQSQSQYNYQHLDINVDTALEELSPTPAPLSSWTGPYFNKASNFYSSHVPNLLPEKDVEQTRLFELYRLHMVSFELNQGDTLVFIDYPVHHRGVLDYTDCNGIVYKSQKFQVHSSKLLETGSPKFAELLGPTYQFKIQRRRKMVNKLPDGIKYLLDLTPPSEGDELVFQMTELSLTPGIIKWWSSYILNGVDPFLVCGHDDICKCNRQPKGTENNKDVDANAEHDSATPIEGNAPTGYRLKQLKLDPERALQMKATNEDAYETPLYRHIPDYCPIRHRNGIVRLLMLIEGKGCILDSAPRLFTILKLSCLFECSSMLTDRVTQWIMHGQNTAFIEVLPEEALQIGSLLKIPPVMDSAFRILVNELALKLADTNPTKHNAHSQTTIFGRRLGQLPDELSNIVQHGAQALVDRVSDINTTYSNPNLFGSWDIDEWAKLQVTEQLLEQENTHLSQIALEKLRLLMSALTHEFTHAWGDAIDSAPVDGFSTYNGIDRDRLTYVEPKDFDKMTFIMMDFNPIQMLLCAVPYNDLGVELDNRRWNYSRCKLDGHRHKSYASLVQEATIALDDFLACTPRLFNNLLWSRILALGDREFPEMGMRSSHRPIVSLNALEAAVKDRLRPLTLSWRRENFWPPLNLTRHLLLTLTENELKYLPLWCGGNDDGSGGVFGDAIPSADLLVAPNGPGPGFHTGYTISTPSSVCGSIIEDMDALRVWGSTSAASMTQDRLIASESSFTLGESDVEFTNARYAMPADHQTMGEAVNMTVETTDSESASVIEAWSSNRDDSDDDACMWDSDDSDDTVV
ncbi:hypothetical protein FOPG_01598 [Fusarium oxysporum f. sp. conglutinans race 2 54008]|uniref:Uncharacterized protein n=2 Tax=Fusarium oxysporum f. sp. conglutinans TaxID=100902 RepID=A0A8H6GTN9_FUSOX|nr:hypothetical protein FOPG_01598 [Fusarium oxysporum f. sp. conglutinans race 2 54008]KAF6524168.1 hypothetical protein HZS61_012667 [Fusarium oxysporum f. sp. conglutinans]KAG6985209.1 hypothetical protein FocnCong_v005702 [Fusarium oxysporum f. sp. conglutinans]KAI8409793.1 hypothetical protein FOFC_09635 [Fusarium oxysporum]KAK2692748.1 hypothetical protein QWA68_009753 [Fusarium oxysporum]